MMMMVGFGVLVVVFFVLIVWVDLFWLVVLVGLILVFVVLVVVIGGFLFYDEFDGLVGLVLDLFKW